MKDPREIVLEPILTEKALNLKDQHHQYIFKVDRSANKIEIRNAVQKRFAVRVTEIRTVNVKGKQRQRFTKRGRVTGYTASYKKAIVSLAEGDKLDFLENM